MKNKREGSFILHVAKITLLLVANILVQGRKTVNKILKFIH
jgi:hypothetical protein